LLASFRGDQASVERKANVEQTRLRDIDDPDGFGCGRLGVNPIKEKRYRGATVLWKKAKFRTPSCRASTADPGRSLRDWP